MARIRTLRPTVWSDPRFVECSLRARLTLVGIVSKTLDDAGRGSANPRVIRGEVYPMDDTVMVADVEHDLAEVYATGILVPYEANGQRFHHLPEWLDPESPWCQKIDRPSRSLLPPPPGNVPQETSREHTEPSSSPRRALALDGRGGEETGGDEEPLAAAAVPPAQQPLTASPGEMKGARAVAEPSSSTRSALEENERQVREAAAAQHQRRRQQAASWAREHPDEVREIETQIDRELRQFRGEKSRDEIRRTRILVEILRRVDLASAQAAGAAAAAPSAGGARQPALAANAV